MRSMNCQRPKRGNVSATTSGNNFPPGLDGAAYMVALKGPGSYDLPNLSEDIINALSGWKQDKAVMAMAANSEEILKKNAARRRS